MAREAVIVWLEPARKMIRRAGRSAPGSTRGPDRIGTPGGDGRPSQLGIRALAGEYQRMADENNLMD